MRRTLCFLVVVPRVQDDEVGRRAFVRLKHFYTDTWVHCTSIPIDRDTDKPIMLKVRAAGGPPRTRRRVGALTHASRTCKGHGRHVLGRGGPDP